MPKHIKVNLADLAGFKCANSGHGPDFTGHKCPAEGSDHCSLVSLCWVHTSWKCCSLMWSIVIFNGEAEGASVIYGTP